VANFIVVNWPALTCRVSARTRNKSTVHRGVFGSEYKSTTSTVRSNSVNPLKVLLSVKGSLLCVSTCVLFSVVGVPLQAQRPGDGLIPCSRRDLPGVEMMHCLKINSELEYVVTAEYDLRHGFDTDPTFPLNWLLATIQRDVCTLFATEQHVKQSKLQAH